MTFGRVRVAIFRRCPDCDERELIEERKLTEENQVEVLDAAEASGFSSSFEHDERCTSRGDLNRTPAIEVRVLDVDERLTKDVDLLRRRYEVIAEKVEDAGEDPYLVSECRAAIEAIDRVRELYDGRDRVDEDDPVIDVEDLDRGDDR